MPKSNQEIIDNFIAAIKNLTDDDDSINGWVGGCNSLIKQTLGDGASNEFLEICQGPPHEFAAEARRFLQGLRRRIG